MWRIFRRRQDPALSDVLARLEALEGRAGRQDQRQQASDARIDTAYSAFGRLFARAGVTDLDLEDTAEMPALLHLVPGRRRHSA